MNDYLYEKYVPFLGPDAVSEVLDDICALYGVDGPDDVPVKDLTDFLIAFSICISGLYIKSCRESSYDFLVDNEVIDPMSDDENQDGSAPRE